MDTNEHQARDATLFALTKYGRVLECRVRFYDEGNELQILIDGVLHRSHVYAPVRQTTLFQEAVRTKHAWKARGWADVPAGRTDSAPAN